MLFITLCYIIKTICLLSAYTNQKYYCHNTIIIIQSFVRLKNTLHVEIHDLVSIGHLKQIIRW